MRRYNSSRSALPFEDGMSQVVSREATEAGVERAVLVGIITPQQDECHTNEYLDELAFLAETAGAVTAKRFTQRLNGPSSVTYLGIGKLQEIRRYIEEEEEAERSVDMVIFDDELSAKQLRNIEQELKVKILASLRNTVDDGTAYGFEFMHEMKDYMGDLGRYYGRRIRAVYDDN